ncbi:hypothetical protein CONLIGDRAFT_435407 [Coniochaeta ligniaria NRRL 30616]|uniref:Uncharacterized protein n=1 Tax=Coniochaeta ligniaria NRRL 30616 TaxID=1408157 RepID=A0A1J7J2H3_9PEZI|nr:hypothetical protein CONLIGDRAFT_435407 [Coniochaeta ligniaria NRRL 30616]
MLPSALLMLLEGFARWGHPTTGRLNAAALNRTRRRRVFLKETVDGSTCRNYGTHYICHSLHAVADAGEGTLECDKRITQEAGGDGDAGCTAAAQLAAGKQCEIHNLRLLSRLFSALCSTFIQQLSILPLFQILGSEKLYNSA